MWKDRILCRQDGFQSQSARDRGGGEKIVVEDVMLTQSLAGLCRIRLQSCIPDIGTYICEMTAG